ncbi:hypothetical protein [Neisseria musculi]|uniref:Membrane protein n=1 Tax=Neisseria musculi TaxID=1815583 RepID=A0A7H1MDL4_9NEIS|nr:hypothetical protein [Neisseria musculi]QNT59729.1 putative membrane protein [Neisseria musculi]
MAGWDVWISVVYIAVFFTAAFKAGEFQWLWGSVLLWFGFGLAGARLLPGIWGIIHLAPLYPPHLYIIPASLFFFANHWKKVPEKKMWQAENANGFISLFAVSGMLMGIVSAVLALVVLSRFPAGITPYVLPVLLQLYAFEPAYWFGMQAVIMVVFYLHRKVIAGEAANRFSRLQLQLGFLLALLFQTACTVVLLSDIRYG